MTSLSRMDVKKLTEEPSPKVRGMLAEKIATDYREQNFSDAESAIANDIFRILLKDVEVRVRKALAEQLAYCPNAPHDIILKLANDEAEVAVHVLEHSTVLTEEDLITIVESTYEVVKLCAIARRETISEDLSGTLLETTNTLVMQNLFRNKGAALSERQMMKAWDKIVATNSLLETLVDHGKLPLIIAEKLFLAVTEEYRVTLNKQYKFSTPIINKATNDVREWELLGITPADDKADPDDELLVEGMVDELYLKGRLTHSLLMRALCVGNLKVFEAGIARMASVPRVNARILLMEATGLGLKAIYQAASMPEGFYDAIRVLLRISLEETEFGRVRRSDFRKRVIDRIYQEKYNRTVENMEYMLSIIGGKTLERANLH